jgi:hypothetical protein
MTFVTLRGDSLDSRRRTANSTGRTVDLDDNRHVKLITSAPVMRIPSSRV